VEASKSNLNYIKLDGNVGLHGERAGLAMGDDGLSSNWRGGSRQISSMSEEGERLKRWRRDSQSSLRIPT